MLIDCHVHTRLKPGPPRRVGGTWATPDQLVEMLTARGIGRALLLPIVSPECAHDFSTVEECLEAVALHPDFFIPAMNIDPRMDSNSGDADFGHLMDHYMALGCRSIGELMANLPLNDERVWNLFRQAEERRLPITFHLAIQDRGMYGLIDDSGLPLLEEALRAFPSLPFIGHSQPFWAEISAFVPEAQRNGYPTGPVLQDGAVVRLMRECPNLYGDLSAGSGYNAISRDPEFGFRFLEEFQDRLFFGTDICDPTNETPIVNFLNAAVENGHISRDAYEKIGWRNMERLLEL